MSDSSSKKRHIDTENLDSEKNVSQKRAGSIAATAVIEESLKELLERKSREERKANGRLVALTIAFFVIVLAIYHTWLRNTSGLAGVLVPAAIMLTYGIWVVVLAKRDKQRRILFEKHLEEVTQKNKVELMEKVKAKQHAKKTARRQRYNAKLHYEHEKFASGGTKLRLNRSSIRQKLFKQNAATNLLILPAAALANDFPEASAVLPLVALVEKPNYTCQTPVHRPTKKENIQ